MSEEKTGLRKLRRGWLKFMYIYTIFGAGFLGIGILAAPNVIRSIPGFPDQDPIVLGIVGSVYATFGFLSILGVRFPLTFVPVLLLQLCYKVVWASVIAAPLIFSGRLPMHEAMFLVIFATYIIGDLIAIPFPYLFSKEEREAGKLKTVVTPGP